MPDFRRAHSQAGEKFIRRTLPAACLLLIAALVLGQTSSERMAPPDVPIHPSMASVPPETVVAVVDGKKITAGDLGRLLTALNLGDNFLKNKKEFLRTFGLLARVSATAEKNGLDRISPYKERLEYGRMMVLQQAAVDDVLHQKIIQEADQKKYYQQNADKFTQVIARVIQIGFNNNPAPNANPKPLSEAQAKAKAAELLKQLQGGADFVDLVRKHSTEPALKQRDGLLVMKRSDGLPEEVKKAVFSAKKGQIAGPVMQPNGFYLFRIDDVKAQPFQEVRDEIYKELKEAHFRQWMESARNSVQVKIEKEELFDVKTPPPAK